MWENPLVGKSPHLELGAESKKHIQVLSPCPSHAVLKGRGRWSPGAQPVLSRFCTHTHRTARRSVSGRAYIHPRGHHGLIAHPLGRLQLGFGIPGVIQGVLGDDTGWLSPRNHGLPTPEAGPTWALGVLISIPLWLTSSPICHQDVPSHLVLSILPSSSY